MDLLGLGYYLDGAEIIDPAAHAPTTPAPPKRRVVVTRGEGRGGGELTGKALEEMRCFWQVLCAEREGKGGERVEREIRGRERELGWHLAPLPSLSNL